VSFILILANARPHVHFLVFEAWFTNARSRIIGCYKCLSNGPVLPPHSVIVSLFQGKIWFMVSRLPSSVNKIVLQQGSMGKPRLLLKKHWLPSMLCHSLPALSLWLRLQLTSLTMFMWSVDAHKQASQDIWKWIISMQW